MKKNKSNGQEKAIKLTTQEKPDNKIVSVAEHVQSPAHISAVSVLHR